MKLVKPKFFPLALYRVRGESMQPFFSDGAILLGWRWFRPKPGQVVVLAMPERIVVKRIKHLAHDGIWAEGDNKAASTDSRTKGLYPAEALRARVIMNWQIRL